MVVEMQMMFGLVDHCKDLGLKSEVGREAIGDRIRGGTCLKIFLDAQYRLDCRNREMKRSV